MYVHIYAGIDYLVNIENTSSRTFTVVFQSKQANSTEHVIFLSDDECHEGTKSFRLRIATARFIGQAAALFKAQDGLNNTLADVHIYDNDCEFRVSACTIYLQYYHLFAHHSENGLFIYNYVTCHALFPSTAIGVKWTTSYPTTITEGEGVELRLSGEAFGCYPQPIAIDVICVRPLIDGGCLGMDTTTRSNSSMLNVG